MFNLINRQKKIAISHIVQSDDEDNSDLVSTPPSKLTLIAEKPSIISSGCVIQGIIHSEGILLLEGTISGSIDSVALTVGKSGRIDGNVACKVLHIKGYFSGEALCDELVIDETAVIEASIRYKHIKVARGAVIIGALGQGSAKHIKTKKAAA